VVDQATALYSIGKKWTVCVIDIRLEIQAREKKKLYFYGILCMEYCVWNIVQRQTTLSYETKRGGPLVQ